MEKWFAENWHWFLGITALFIGAFYRLGKMEDEMRDHLDKGNAAPHPACPVHNSKFDDLKKSVDEVKDGLKLLDTRIYDFMRSNGYHSDGKQ